MAAKSPAKKLQQLRAEHEAMRLTVDNFHLQQELESIHGVRITDALESYDYRSPDNFVNIYDYLPQRHVNAAGIGAIPTSINDRQDGRMLPFFQTEQELALIRGMSRAIFEINPVAKGALEKLTNYVIGSGFKHTASGVRDTNSPLAKSVQCVIDQFLEENKWHGRRDRNIFSRTRRDGEAGVTLWHVGGGRTQARSLEPDAITEPADPRAIEDWLGSEYSSWSFGVHTEPDDVETVHGYYVQWSSNPMDWDYLPGGNEPIISPGGDNSWCVFNSVNTDLNVKRGLPDAFCTAKNLELARKLLRNIGEGASVQSAIAFFREHAAGVTGDKISTFLRQRASQSYQSTTAAGSRTNYIQQFDPGTIVDHGQGITYKLSALGNNNAPVFLEVVLALVSSAAAVWSMPLYMALDLGKGASYAADLVHESPFVKACEVKQQDHVQVELEVLWKVVEFAWKAGRFGDVPWEQIKAEVKITISPPDVAIRDRDKESARRVLLMNNGIVAPKTVAEEEGYDYAQEVTAGAKRFSDIQQAAQAGERTPITPRATDDTSHPLMDAADPLKQDGVKPATESIDDATKTIWQRLMSFSRRLYP
jgi:hypothetical protein